MTQFYIGFADLQKCAFDDVDDAVVAAEGLARETGRQVEVVERISSTTPIVSITQCVTIYDEDLAQPKFSDDQYGEDEETVQTDSCENKFNPAFFPSFYTLESITVDSKPFQQTLVH